MTDVYPMTSEQEVMWLDDYVVGGPSNYLESWVYHLTGQVDRAAVRQAWDGMVARHEALRSSFGLDGDERPMQRVSAAQRRPLAARSCPAEQVDETLRELVREPMDLDGGAVRATLLETGADSVILVVQMHHVVLDDWSFHIMEREFEAHYRAHVEGRPVALAPVPLQPGPYAARQRSAPRDPAVAEYWRRNLAELRDGAGSTLPADDPAPVPTAGDGHGDRALFTVCPSTTRQVRRLCGRLRVTPFTVFAAATALLLNGAGAGEDLLVATPVSLRGTAEHDQMIAPLSVLLPLRFRVRTGDTFADLVGQARARTHEAIEFRDVSIADLARSVLTRGQPKRNLCRTVIVLDDGADSGVDLPGVKAERLFVHPGTAKFDLCFFFTAAGGAYDGMLDYDTDRYSPATAGQWIDRMLALLDQATADPDKTVAALVG